jgi:hypothetical protein
MFIYKSVILILLLAFISCKEKFPIYTTSFPDINCLSYDFFIKSKDKQQLQSIINLQNTKNCPNTLKVIKYHTTQCSNPIVKSIGSDFDGFVRIQITNNKKIIYKIQSNFKSDEDASFDRIIQKMKLVIK